MALNLTNAVHTAQQLLVYTVEAPNFSDKVDVIFVAEMIEKIGTFAEKYKEVKHLTANVVTCKQKKNAIIVTVHHIYIVILEMSISYLTKCIEIRIGNPR